MTSGFALLAHWPVRKKLNRVSSVQLRRSVRALSQCVVSQGSPGGASHILVSRSYGLPALPFFDQRESLTLALYLTQL